MKKIFILINLAMLLLVGCSMEPMMFGMPESQFKQLPSNQQSQVIASYNRQQEIKTQNEPLNNAVDMVGFLGELNSKK